MHRPSRLVAALLAAIPVALGWVSPPVSAAQSVNESSHAYTYETVSYDEPTVYAALERGPPEQRGQVGVSLGQVTVDDGSTGALPRPSATVYTAYDVPSLPARGDNATGTTPVTVQPIDGDIAALGPAGVAAKTLAGSGPVPGVLEASGRVKSFAALRNYNPKGGVEYVFDPATGTFAVGRPATSAGLKGSPHEQLAQAIGANPSTVVGGTLTRGSNGAFITTEQSGHFWQNWTPEVRQQFVSTMRGYGFDVLH
jgi:hypothetical protein